MDSPLQMQLQIFALITEELALLYDDTNLLGQPTRGGPKAAMVLARDGSVEHQNCRKIVNGFSRCNRLVALTSATPSLRCRLSLHAILKNL
jgi:hypothetical protein